MFPEGIPGLHILLNRHRHSGLRAEMALRFQGKSLENYKYIVV